MKNDIANELENSSETSHWAKKSDGEKHAIKFECALALARTPARPSCYRPVQITVAGNQLEPSIKLQVEQFIAEATKILIGLFIAAKLTLSNGREWSGPVVFHLSSGAHGREA